MSKYSKGVLRICFGQLFGIVLLRTWDLGFAMKEKGGSYFYCDPESISRVKATETKPLKRKIRGELL